MMPDISNAIIIGTGVIGASTAFELSKLGWKTLSIEWNTRVGPVLCNHPDALLDA